MQTSARGSREDETLLPPLAIIFDWDNTLIDSWAAIEDAQNFTLAYFGLKPWTFEEIRTRVRGSMRDTFPQLFGERWREAGEVFYARFTEHHVETLRPLPGAEEMLVALKRAGVHLAVVSNKKGDYLRAEAAHLAWEPFFVNIVGAFDAPRDKPATDPVELALAGSGITSGRRVWFAGDTDIDLQCAANSGCLPVLVRATPPEPDEFPDHPPAVYAADCISLLKIVRNL